MVFVNIREKLVCFLFLTPKSGRSTIISKKDLAINKEIAAAMKSGFNSDVRVVGEENEAIGIMRLSEALTMADDKNVDLVLIAPQGNPPVCRIMDYGKFKFEQSKRDKELRKNQKQFELKEVRMSLNIDDNDLNTKVGNVVKFLKSGDKVKITIRFRGREMTHPKLGERLMEKIKIACAEFGTAEIPSKFEGRNFFLILSPKK
jgi:translation initiation factor IF-3